MTMVVALAKFFRDPQKQSIAVFLQEVKKLTPQDLSELKPMLEDALNVKIE